MFGFEFRPPRNSSRKCLACGRRTRARDSGGLCFAPRATYGCCGRFIRWIDAIPEHWGDRKSVV